MGQKDRKESLRRKLTPTEEARALQNEQVMAMVKQELGDPQRLPVHLQRLGQLAFTQPSLRQLRLPEPFPTAALELSPPAEVEDPLERQRAHRAALAAAAGSPDLLPGYERLLDQAMGQVKDMQDLLAVAAGRALLASCREQPQSYAHPFWALLVELSFSELWMSGLVLSELGLRAQRTSKEELGPLVARALAQGELGRELDELGVEDTDPQRLTDALLAHIHGDRADLAPYELEFDAVLHLVALHAGLVAHLAERVAKEGLSDPVRQEILAHYEEAYADDITPELAAEVQAWARGHLLRLRDDPEQAFGPKPDPAAVRRERLRAAGLYCGLRLFAPAESKLLRAMHLRGLHRAPRLASEHERPSVQKLWGDPRDMHALEEYEQILRDLRQPNRARRVARYRQDLRQARQAHKAEQAEAEGQ